MVIISTVRVSILTTLALSASTGSIVVFTRCATVVVVIVARSCGGLFSTVALIVIIHYFLCGMVHECRELSELLETRLSKRQC